MKKLLAFFVLLMTSVFAYGQAISVNGGSIQGTVTDASGAAVPGANVVIASPDTGYNHTLKTDGAGFYAVGPLTPGAYTITVSASGFKQYQEKTAVRTGTATPGSVKLSVGSENETIEVNAGAVQVNTDQAGVSDVITSEQIRSLPVNGRNFLDLAQIEPGVILQSGESFDPTKAGYSAISVSGVSGRTTRILLDGQDITDETVGTTIFNVSQGAIDEFQLNRSTQDVSGDVTSTGQVLVATRSGTNAFHGELFYNFQDYRAGFARSKDAVNPPFQRNQFGGAIGGPIFKDKLFFFANAERIKQDSSAASPVNGNVFPTIIASNPTIPSPYRETYSTGRLDWNGPWGGHYYARVSYNVNSVASNYGEGYWLYANRDNTPGYAFGADFAHGHFTHSFRGSYEKFHNMIADKTAGNSSLYNPIPSLAFYYSAQHLYAGPNYLAPQGTFQSDKQIRYDGSWTLGRHNVRYGYSLNRILGGGFAAFFGLTPRTAITASTLFKTCNNDGVTAACPGDPLHGYFPSTTYLGNGQGFFTEHSGFGLPGGGVEDWRQGLYIADNWKVTPSFTLTAGLRWSVDTDRANQDLATPLCSDVDPDSVTPPCSGSTKLFSLWNPSFTQSHVNQPWNNFAPQVGINFAPGNHKTSIRAGFGIFYEGDVFNNTTNARSSIIKQGAFFDDRHICNGTYSIQNFPGQGSTPVTTVDGLTIAQVCALPLVQAAPHLVKLQQQYQTATKANSLSSNAGYIGETLIGDGIYSPNYTNPYSEQWNGGIQREVWKGAVLSADYVHNSTLKFGQQLDLNHVGAARYLNTAAAQNAVKATLAACSTSTTTVSTIDQAITACPGIHKPTLAQPNGGPATIADFAGNGLDSGRTYLGGSPASGAGLTASTGAAFPGANPALGSGNFIQPIGKSGYDALQLVLRQSSSHPAPGIMQANYQISYNLSRIVTTAAAAGSSDQFFSNLSWDYDNPNAFMGDASLDHTHQLSFGGSFLFKYGPQAAVLAHFNSAASTSLVLDSTNKAGTAAGSIFTSDVTGDGTPADPAPGTLPGAYMRTVKGGNLQSFINNLNAKQANTLTPAGKSLVSAGIMSQGQLVALGGAIPTIATTPQSQAIQNPAFRALDMVFSYPIHLAKLREGLSLTPAVAFYNVFNFSNFSGFTGTLLNINSTGLSPTNPNAGYVSGPNDYPTLDANRTQRGSGTFDQGGPRTTEFQLKLNF